MASRPVSAGKKRPRKPGMREPECECGHTQDEHGGDADYPCATDCSVDDCVCIAFEAVGGDVGGSGGGGDELAVAAVECEACDGTGVVHWRTLLRAGHQKCGSCNGIGLVMRRKRAAKPDGGANDDRAE